MLSFGERFGFGSFEELHKWSVEKPDEFWVAAWDELGVVGDKGECTICPAEPFWKTRFFCDASLNAAENLLGPFGDDRPDFSGGHRLNTAEGVQGEAVGGEKGESSGGGRAAIIAFSENPDDRREISGHQLRLFVGQIQAAMRRAGVGKGDCVAALMPNTIETVAIMLAAAASGAVFTSTSPDFGVAGVVDRFGQVQPKLLFVCDAYSYNGRTHRVANSIGQLEAELPSVAQIVVVPFLAEASPIDPTARWENLAEPSHQNPSKRREFSTEPSHQNPTATWETLAELSRQDPTAKKDKGRANAAVELGVWSEESTSNPRWENWGAGGAVWLNEFLEGIPPAEPVFERLPFDHPWYVLFSSGTTGKPKCIVHRAGGVLLKHLVEHQLHCDIKPGDRVFYYTTTGWMMWNWQVSALASGATLVLYDGAPTHPNAARLFDLVDEAQINLLGISAKFIETLPRLNLQPITTHSLESLRTIVSTGSPLSPEGFETIYRRVKADAHLASISGGTDLCGCLVLGDPSSPVFAGEIQRPALGLDIDVVDQAGEPVPLGQQGELVCRNAFPSMPLGFLGDKDQSRYEASYFADIPGVWKQGDFAARTENGGFIIYGRSDSTLNPSGVRIGTAEIYRPLLEVSEVEDCVAIGQRFEGDVRIVLFVVLADGQTLSERLAEKIKAEVRKKASPRHVPKVIGQVSEIPRTRSGKVSELAVSAMVNGHDVTNAEALVNPLALAQFKNHPALAR